jgi:NAD+ diphosphatase
MSSSTELLECWFVFHNDSLIFINNANQYALLTSLAFLPTESLRIHALGIFNNARCYCAEIQDASFLPDNAAIIPLRKSFDVLGMEWYTAAVKAYSIINWDRNHQYCGRCGQPTMHKAGTLERVCTSCGLSFFPRISPSIIVLIRKGDQLLMARGHHFPPGAYGLIAGFLEAGENIEEAIHREVQEEVGITINNLRYFASQPWPFPDSLMIGFTADYVSGELTIDHRELEDAGWYRYDNLPGRPSFSLSISGKLIDHFIAEQKSLHGAQYGSL